MINIMKTHKNARISVEGLKEPRIQIKNKREPSRFEIIESQSKRRAKLQSKVTRTTTPRSQSNVPSPIVEVGSSENSEDSEASLSKQISSSDSLPSEAELNEYVKS
ncbi:hypothetical protein O181_084259 [Austropuccinia psidii MF-1]|uniref:Uncharacterized protein n=1 Tax=Austropuccinia psidii MF-1 TaxID=1389203 RepID=A0A9Q3FSS8_9BASI|nr:hypothetical protein [Austropuccinia psidii MF-1]